MKTIISEKSLRIDRIEVCHRQIVNLPVGFLFGDLQPLNEGKKSWRKITITRNGVTAEITKAREKIYLQHLKFLNGNHLLRDAVGIPSRYADQMSVDGKFNFLPIDSLDPDCIPDFLSSTLPEMLEEQSRTRFANMTSGIGDAIRTVTSGEATVYPTPKDRALTIRKVEGGVDVLIPSNYDLLNDYNFAENLATLGEAKTPIWDSDKTHGDPGDDAPKDCWTIHGKLHRYRTPFAIYIKDKNNKNYWQVRFEMRPTGHSLAQTFGGMTFLLDGDEKRLASKFNFFLQGHVLPTARRLFDLDYPAISKRDRDQLWSAEVAQLLTRHGYPISNRLVDKISQRLVANNLTIRPSKSKLNTAVQESIRASDLFMPTDCKGLLCINRRGLPGMSQP